MNDIYNYTDPPHGRCAQCNEPVEGCTCSTGGEKEFLACDYHAGQYEALCADCRALNNL